MPESSTFTPLPLEPGLLLDLAGAQPPARVFGWYASTLALPAEATHFGMVAEGEAELRDDEGGFRLGAGMFFVLPGRGLLLGGGGRGLVVTRPRYRGLRQVGGPLEAVGRLRYLNGCSDTLIAAPPRRGDPCLNHLHVPPRTRQTVHTHPSARIGVILRGCGVCWTPECTFGLEPGLGWYIPAGCRHAFHTNAQSLDVIAWHPDSDFGPTDEDHPMINRTVVGERKEDR